MEGQTGIKGKERQRHMNKCGIKGSITEMGKGISNQVKTKTDKFKTEKSHPKYTKVSNKQ